MTMDWQRFSNPASRYDWSGHKAPADFSGKIYIERVRLNRDGYTSTGEYFGVGQPLYRISSDEEWYHPRSEYDDPDGYYEYVDQYIRADDRKDAKRMAREMYPKAKVSR